MTCTLTLYILVSDTFKVLFDEKNTFIIYLFSYWSIDKKVTKTEECSDKDSDYFGVTKDEVTWTERKRIEFFKTVKIDQTKNPIVS